MSVFHHKERMIEPVVPTHNQQVSIGSYLARRIAEAGARHYFTVPGDFTLALLDEFLKEPSLSMVGCCNELNAGYAADGYCRATKGLGVVMVTYMVGGLSVINAAAGAYSDDLPLLVISGGPNSHDGQDRHLIHHTIGEIELYQSSKCFEPVVAKTFVVRHPKDAQTMIDEALSICLYQRKPVYLEIACNLSTFKIFEPVPMKFSDPAHPTGTDFVSDPEALYSALDEILHLLNAATKPVLIAGVKLRKCGSAGDFMNLASAMQCGVAVSPDAKGLFHEDHPFYMGCWWGCVSSPHVQEIVESADLVVFAGTIFNDYTTVGWTAEISTSKSIVIYPDHINICGKHFANVYMKDIISKLTPRVPVKDASMINFRRYKDGDPEFVVPQINNLSIADKEKALTLKFISGQIQARLKPTTSLVIETGDCWFIGQNLHLPAEAIYHIQMQYGSIGWAVGATLGVAMAVQGKRRVLALIGDGSFQVTAQEVSTMIRQGVRATILLFNNNGYTIEVQIHDGPYNDIQDWKYSELMSTFNATNSKNAIGVKATTNQQLVDALNMAENFEGVALIECCIGRDDCTSNLLIWGSKVAHSNGRL